MEQEELLAGDTPEARAQRRAARKEQRRIEAATAPPRVVCADRSQVEWRPLDLESLVPPAHRARSVWAFVERLDLTAFYARIKARGSWAGRDATDPKVLLALWLYATAEGIGSARELERLCQAHDAYRWLRGGRADQLSRAQHVSGRASDGPGRAAHAGVGGAAAAGVGAAEAGGPGRDAGAGRGGRWLLSPAGALGGVRGAGGSAGGHAARSA